MVFGVKGHDPAVPDPPGGGEGVSAAVTIKKRKENRDSAGLFLVLPGTHP